MESLFERINGILKITVTGRLVASGTTEFKEQVLQQLEDGSNDYRVVFDLSKMEHIDSSGLGVLVTLLQTAREKGGTVKLAGIQPRPMIVFNITKVSKVFSLYKTAEEALESFTNE